MGHKDRRQYRASIRPMELIKSRLAEYLTPLITLHLAVLELVTPVHLGFWKLSFFQGELSVDTRKVLRCFSIITLLSAICLLSPAAFSRESGTKRKVSHRVVPDYPALARQMNITGKVKIEVTVAPDGHVKTTHAVGGSPLLLDAAIRAVKNWKFEAGPKETTEIVEFDFNPQQ